MSENRYAILWHALENIEFGAIEIELPNGNKMNFSASEFDKKCHLKINDWQVFDRILVGGDIALGETYMQKMWESSDLAAFLTFLAKNSRILEKFFHANKLRMLWLAFTGFFRKNSKFGSRKNIKFHYDLGNDFYELWLDESMTYSSGIFEDKTTLNAAQNNKYQRILDKINPGKVLEIGCGWGSFALAAAKKGFVVKGLTISQKQYDFAMNRVEKSEFNDKIALRMQDYRDEKGEYDAIVSIEMFEAVGKQYWSKYFQKIKDCLKKNGTAMIQVITIDDEVYENYQKRADFIQKHIFPGGFLPSKAVFRQYGRDYGLEIADEFSFGLDYEKTLLCWLENFDLAYDKVIALGFDDEFVRKWRFYLAYCAAGFAAKRTDVVQFLLKK